MLSWMPRRGQKLSREQGHPFRRPPHPGLVLGVGAGRASGGHLRYLALRRAAEREVHDARPSPLPPGKIRCGGGGSVRRGTANRTGWPASSARHSTRDTVPGSAQCRSSRATTSPSAPGGTRAAAPLPLTACKSKPRPRRPAGPPATAPGSRTVRCGSHGASEGSPGSGRLRSSCSKASVTGRYGALADRQRSGKGRLQRLDLRPPPHQDRPQHLAHDPSFPHRRQGRSMITRPTPAGPIPSALSLIAALTAQNARIWTAVLMIGAEWASVQIGGYLRGHTKSRVTLRDEWAL